MIETPLLRELGIGAAASAVGGATVWGAGRRAERVQVEAFGRQTLAWAGINGLLAVGGWAAQRRRARSAGGGADETADRARTLRRVLLVNSGLDVGYLVGGAALARCSRRQGDGLAIIVQGAFLLWLDTRHARRIGAIEAKARG